MPKVLLIEDEESLRNLYTKSLVNCDFKVETATDGGDALIKLTQYKPDVIVLDIVMPNMDGMEVLKIIKNDPKLKRIPVLMLTSVTDINKMKQCLEMGAMGYVTKGNSSEEIVQRVNLILGSFNGH